MGERKIVQIATTAEVGQYDRIFALANDGTVWFADVKVDDTIKWLSIPTLPQGDLAAPLHAQTEARDDG